MHKSPAITSFIDIQRMCAAGIEDLYGMLAALPGFVLQDRPLRTRPQMVSGVNDAFNGNVFFICFRCGLGLATDGFAQIVDRSIFDLLYNFNTSLSSPPRSVA